MRHGGFGHNPADALILPILCYHKVGPERDEGRWLNISPERLESHVRHFARRGYNFLAAADLAHDWPERAVCLTFDDAYQSMLDYGLPVLLRHRAAASIYAVPACVGGTSAWDGDRARPLADWDSLMQAHKAGIEIGNHSMTHAWLGKLDEAAQAEEIRLADEELARRIAPPRSFCFPYGSRSPASAGVLLSAGYRVGLAVDRRPARPEDDRLALPRIVIAFSDALPKLLYKIHIRPHLP